MFKKNISSHLYRGLAATLLSACEPNQYFSALPDANGLLPGQALPGLGSSGESTPVPAEWVTQLFRVPVNPTPKLDLLFVIDNSGSMADEQGILAQSFTAFIQQFQNRGIDFQIGILTTDTTPNNTPAGAGYWNGSTAGSRYYGYLNAGPGRLLSKFPNERWLKNSTVNLVQKFQSNALAGTLGSGSEQGLDSVYLATAPMMLENFTNQGFNYGFIREDALFATVVVSDEDECISNGETPAQRIARVKDRLDLLKPSSSKGWRMDFVMGTNVPEPSPLPIYPQGNLPYPFVYKQAADAYMGQKINIGSNFSQPLINLGQEIAVHTAKQYALSHAPIAGSFDVKINGAAIAEDPANGWSYISVGNLVEFNGSALASLPGSELTIRYQQQ